MSPLSATASEHVVEYPQIIFHCGNYSIIEHDQFFIHCDSLQ